jgi:hypothetical protein
MNRRIGKGQVALILCDNLGLNRERKTGGDDDGKATHSFGIGIQNAVPKPNRQGTGLNDFRSPQHDVRDGLL